MLRHGETDYNKNGMVQGRGVDAFLNETGVEQARRAYHALKEIPFKTAFTSTLVRTHQTVNGFLNDGLQHIILEGLDEISWGDQEGVKASLEAKNLYAQTVQSWREGKLELNVGGGESPIEVMRRQEEAWKQIVDCPDDHILICMHGRAIRVLLCWLLNYPLNYMDGFPHQNCAYYKLVLRGGDLFVDEFNQTAHLSA